MRINNNITRKLTIHVKQVFRCIFIVGVILGFVSGLVACGGASAPASTKGSAVNPSPTSNEDQTKLYVGMTDAEGDFVRYEVDVTQITMVRASGALVEVLPHTTTIDFAQYVEVTELLTVLDAPSGVYESASLSLDFSNAAVDVQDESGNVVSANLVDSNGEAMTQVDVQLTFNDSEGFVLRPGVPAQITLDFDLDASNQIVIDGESAEVRVNPVLIADTLLEAPKDFRLRGLLGEIASDEAVFAINLRPFRERDGRFGSARVHISENTRFEINGEALDSEAGFLMLQTLQAGAAVITHGQWNRSANEYQASTVFAGSSVPWENADIVRGTVVARSNNLLTVRGASIRLSNGSVLFNDEVSVSLDEGVIIRISEHDRVPRSHDVSVGSRIFAAGEFEDRVLTTTRGLVRIQPTTLSGSVVSVSPMQLDLSFINGRRAAIFDFSGTGVSMELDADPENYELATGRLSLNDIDIGDPIRARGYVAEFGQSPEDFEATTVVNAADVRGQLVVNYGLSGSDLAIRSLGLDGIQLNLEDAIGRHHLIRAGIPTDLNLFDQVPLVSAEQERGIFSIIIEGRIEMYTDFANFVSSLQRKIDASYGVSRFDAQGEYDQNLSIFRSQRISVILSSN